MTSPIRDRVRKFNKYVLNPAMLQLAGRKHWYAAVIRHTGRRSGRRYATPVVAEPVADGFVVPLPYGTGVDWLRNLLAAGCAVVTVHGQTYDITDPEIIDAPAASLLLPSHRMKVFRRFNIDNFLKVRVAR